MTDKEKIICKEYLNDLDKYHSCNEYHLIMGLLDAEPCEDAVSRSGAIIQLSHNKIGDDDCDTVIQRDIETIKRLPSVTPKTPECEDAISRQAAKHALCKAVHKRDSEIPCNNQTCSCLWTGTSVQDYAREINALPSVTPKPKTGKWIVHYECPVCGELRTKYTETCPYCGTKMN